jgi:hypothetical protein
MPEGREPGYLTELEQLKESGDIDKVQEMIKNNDDAWIKRSGGDWQKGKAFELGHDGLVTGVKWYDEKRRKELGKHVDTVDFVKWQDEDHGETFEQGSDTKENKPDSASEFVISLTGSPQEQSAQISKLVDDTLEEHGDYNEISEKADELGKFAVQLRQILNGKSDKEKYQDWSDDEIGKLLEDVEHSESLLDTVSRELQEQEEQDFLDSEEKY